MSEKDLTREVKRIEREMLEAARNLEFETAAVLRDRLQALKKQLFGVEESDAAAQSRPQPTAATSHRRRRVRS